ncbi:unnamed protein product, partial [Prorocentrum cordatum]
SVAIWPEPAVPHRHPLLEPSRAYPSYMAVGARDRDGDNAIKDGRGWAMRRGHCRRLRGDLGRESQRGRATFARSLNRCCRRHSRSARDGPGRLRERRALSSAVLLRCVGDWQLAEEEYPPWSEESTDAGCAYSLCGGGEGGDASAASVCSVVDSADSATTGDWELVEPPQPRLERSASAPVTAREFGAAEASRNRALVPLRAWRRVSLTNAQVTRSHGRARCWRWLLAVELTEHIAALASARKSSATPLRQRRFLREDRLAQTLRTPFDCLRLQFLDEHGQALRTRIGQHLGVHPQMVKLTNAPVGPDPVARFMDAKARLKDCKLLPVYHGTDSRNFQSIFSRGLLIPGRGNELRVAHGSVHGRGIYTAVLENPGRSFSYSGESRSLLVCACLEGGRNSDVHLKRVFGTIVVFDPDRVVPMFVAHDPYRSAPGCAPRGDPPPPPERAGAARAARRRARAAARRAVAAAAAAAPRLRAHCARRAARRRRT